MLIPRNKSGNEVRHDGGAHGKISESIDDLFEIKLTRDSERKRYDNRPTKNVPNLEAVHGQPTDGW